MHSEIHRAAKARARAGSALTAAVVLLGGAVLMMSTLLQVTGSMARRQQDEVERARAFYVAEAGLSEAYEALRVGLRGQIGHPTQPAQFGDGLLWVTASPEADGAQVRLEATALVGRGLVTLGLVAERVETPLGIFAHEDLRFENAALFDGFDAELGSYQIQAEAWGDDEGDYDPTPGTLDGLTRVLFTSWGDLAFAEIEGLHYLLDGVEAHDDAYGVFYAISFQASSGSLHNLLPPDGPTGETVEWWPESLPYPQPAFPEGGSSGDGSDGSVIGAWSGGEITTGNGALIGSNGDIEIGGTGESVKVFGDVVPGLGREVFIGAGGFLSGSSDARLEAVELPAVDVPAVELAEAVHHSGPIPLLISAGTHGYESLSIAPDARLVVRGPATIVVGELHIAAGAELELDTVDGDVDFYLTEGLTFEAGSTVVTSQMPSDVSFQIAADDSTALEPAVQLRAQSQFYGSIYAPQAKIVIGGPFEFYGGIAARMLELEAGARVHFDARSDDLPKIVSWRIENPPAIAKAARRNPFGVLGITADDLLELSQAHDLGGIQLFANYTDLGGIERTYQGLEAEFDWALVASVESTRRSGAPDYASGTWAGVPDPVVPRDGEGTGGGDDDDRIRPTFDALINSESDPVLLALGLVAISPLTAAELDAVHALDPPLPAELLQGVLYAQYPAEQLQGFLQAR